MFLTKRSRCGSYVTQVSRLSNHRYIIQNGELEGYLALEMSKGETQRVRALIEEPMKNQS